VLLKALLGVFGFQAWQIYCRDAVNPVLNCVVHVIYDYTTSSSLMSTPYALMRRIRYESLEYGVDIQYVDFVLDVSQPR